MDWLAQICTSYVCCYAFADIEIEGKQIKGLGFVVDGGMTWIDDGASWWYMKIHGSCILYIGIITN